MRALLVALAVLAAACSGSDPAPPAAASPGAPTTTTPVDDGGTVASVGGERPARLVIPSSWDSAGAPLPLVVLLHGYGANAELQDVYLGVSDTGADLGYLTLTPNGTMDGQGNRFWNVSDAGGLVDDAGYVLDLVDEVVGGYNADPDRVYLVGHSNGGFMANNIACENPDRVAGIVAIAGGLFGAAADCAGPMQVIIVQGTEDGTVPYAGTAFLGTPVLGAEDTVDRWRRAGGCAGAAVEEGPFNFDLLVPGDETTISRWTDCRPGASVALWRMEGSGHIPGFLPSFRSTIMEQLLGTEGR